MVSQEDTIAVDVAVVGAGPGGYVAAIRAAQQDLDVALIGDALGGTCLNFGCIPSKALITAANEVYRLGTSENRGLYADPFVDFSELITWKDGVVNALTNGVETRCADSGVQIVPGRATFKSPDSLSISASADDAPASVSFDHAVIATGSQPIEIPGFSFDMPGILDARQALELDRVPTRLVVVGGGYIGMELSMAFAKLGTEVIVMEEFEQLLPRYDEDIIAPVRKRVDELNINVRLGTRASEAVETETGLTIVDESGREIDTEYAIVAVGRTPNTRSLGLENTEVVIDERGFVKTDERNRTANDNIYAIGDVASEPMLAHAATAEGKAAVKDIRSEKTAGSPSVVPSVVFTDPEIAKVGYTEAEATDSGYDTVVGECPFRANGRALTRDETDGFVRVVADADDGRLLGACAVGPEVSELIGELTLAIELGATADQIAKTVHVHPTLSEAVVEAAENVSGVAIHTSN